MIELTVTIVTYNTDLDVLQNAINSILGETEDLFIVVADNNSDKGYYSKLIKQLRHNKIKVVRTELNGGYGYGHNYAESYCVHSKYHLIMNADIVVHEGSLNKMLDYMKNNNDIAILFPKVLNPDGSIQFLNKREPTLIDVALRRMIPNFLSKSKIIKRRMAYYEMRDIGYESNYDLPLVSGCFMLFDRNFFKKVQGFDESFFMYFEDFDICKRVSEAGGRISYIYSASITHFWERGSSKNVNLFLSLIRSMVLYFNKWGWRLW